jgi:hypothetical protein
VWWDGMGHTFIHKGLFALKGPRLDKLRWLRRPRSCNHSLRRGRGWRPTHAALRLLVLLVLLWDTSSRHLLLLMHLLFLSLLLIMRRLRLRLQLRLRLLLHWRRPRGRRL